LLFHCNGWCFPWTMAARRTNVCLRQGRRQDDLDLIREHKKVTPLLRRPIVQSTLINADPKLREGIRQVHAMVAPPAARAMTKAWRRGLELSTSTGLTEVYGPATVRETRAWKDLDIGKRTEQNGRQAWLPDGEG